MTPLSFVLPPTTEDLRLFVEAGLFDASSVYLVDAIHRRCGDLAIEVQLAAALAARAPRYGHVCVPINDIEHSIVSEDLSSDDLARLPWPDSEHWLACLRTSEAVWTPGGEPTANRRPLILDATNLYLNRLWNYEQQVGEIIRDRCVQRSWLLDGEQDPDSYLDGLIAQHPHSLNNSQLTALRRAVTRRFSVIAGGPGTGKTHTIAELLTVLSELDRTGTRTVRVGLCAPTGKAASRMSEAIFRVFSDLPEAQVRTSFTEQLHGSTIQRMLGSRVDGASRFNETNLLPYDVVIVDEGSMVSLPLMYSLLRATRPEAHLVIVGDPDQLTSIEAGAVLGDIVQAASGPATVGNVRPPLLEQAVTTLDTTHRFAHHSAIARCADLARKGDVEAFISLVHNPNDDTLRFIEHTDTRAIALLVSEMARHASLVIASATGGDPRAALGLLNSSKVLCAVRHGEFGSYHWSNSIEHAAASLVPDTNLHRRSYTGKPLIATKNDYANGIFNGDVGVISEQDHQQRIASGDGEELRWFALSQWSEAEPWWAMTIHRSQGSEFDEVVVVLPDNPIPLVTRELLYTAITRARTHITIIGNDEVLRSAISRRIGRSTGLTPLLQQST